MGTFLLVRWNYNPFLNGRKSMAFTRDLVTPISGVTWGYNPTYNWLQGKPCRVLWSFLKMSNEKKNTSFHGPPNYPLAEIAAFNSWPNIGKPMGFHKP